MHLDMPNRLMDLRDNTLCLWRCLEHLHVQLRRSHCCANFKPGCTNPNQRSKSKLLSNHQRITSLR